MEFLELLLNYTRSGVASRKQQLRRKIDTIAASKRRVSENIKTKIVDTSSVDNLSSYYLTPWTQIVHIALYIPRFAKDIKLLQDLLNLTTDQMQRALEELTRMELLSFEDNRWKPRQDYLHLSRSSPIFHAWKTQSQLAGLQRQAALNETNSTSVTFVFGANEDTRKSLQKKFVAFLKDFEAEVGAADTRHVYQMSFDLFPWV